MKRILTVIVAFALLLCMALTAYAAENVLTVSNADAGKGETIYLTVTLEESITGDTVGLSYSYDHDLLSAVPSSNRWARPGMLTDFDRNDAGVWATTVDTDLKGTLCVLAFQVTDKVDFEETKVTCKVVVKNESEDVGTYTADAVIKCVCDHSYGMWSDDGDIGHNRKCSKCNAQQTMSHDWDDGVKTTEQIVYTCSVCGGTKSIAIQPGTGESQPTEPTQTKPLHPTKPTEPPRPTEPTVTRPTEKRPEATTRPTEETKKPSHSMSGGNIEKEKPTEEAAKPSDKQPEAQEEGNHDHIHDADPKQPEIIKIEGWDEQAQEQEHDHDHVHAEETTPEADPPGVAIGVVLTAAALIAVAVVFLTFLKKKKR